MTFLGAASTSANAITGFDWLTFALAGAGFVVALVALVWQMVSWSYTGARVKVGSSFAVFTGPGGVGPAVVLKARNVGRSAIEVNGGGFLTDDGNQMIPRAVTVGGIVPATLDGGHSLTFVVPIDELMQVPAAAGALRPFVRLGTDKRIIGKRFKVPR